MPVPTPDATALKTDLAGIPLDRPVILAAGTAGTLDEIAGAMPLTDAGAITTKSITREPRNGNPPWRVTPLPAGMLNAIGLANPGVDAFVRDDAPRIGSLPVPVIGSIAGFSVEDYLAVASRFEQIEAMAGVELNVSCPNVHGGVEFGVDPEALAALVREVRAVLVTKRLLVKLSPIVVGRPGMVEIARAAIEPPGATPSGPNQRLGADALCLCNTVPAMAIDVRTRRPRLANITGGLSGPAVHPIALKIVHDVYRGIARQTSTPLVGVGGVTRWERAAEFILAGAAAVQIGTGLFIDPRIPKRVTRGLASWVRKQGAGAISDLVGAVEIAKG